MFIDGTPFVKSDHSFVSESLYQKGSSVLFLRNESKYSL